MTTKSLGALTVDLILETAGFESGMDKSQRIADQKLRRMEQEARARAKAIESAFSEIAGTIGKVFVGVQVAQFTNQTIQLQRRLEDLSKSTEISVTKLAGLEHAARIEVFTDGAVTRKAIRPDDWARIWPELAESEQKPPAAPAIQAQAAINTEASQQAQGVSHG